MNSFLTVLCRRRGIQSDVWTLRKSSFHAAFCSYSHVTGWSGLWWRGRKVSLHDLIETTVPYILGQLQETKKKSASCICAALGIKFYSHYAFIIFSISPEMKIVKGVHCCLKNTIYSLGRPFLWLTKSSEVPSLSSSMDWMREMWTPISRWMPEHSMQVRIPRLVDSHLGSLNREQIRKCVVLAYTSVFP